MNNNGHKTREQIPQKYKWNIEAMYPNEADIQKDLDKGLEYANNFSEFKGRLTESSDTLLEALNLYVASIRLIEKVFVYSHMKRDEDNANSKYNEMYSKAVSVYSEAGAIMSFFSPELLEAEPKLIYSYIDNEPQLEVYRFMIDNIFLAKEHTLTTEQEYVFSSLAEALQAPDEVFSALNDVDMVFGTVINDNGDEVPLTHGSYSKLMESENREVRKETYYKLYNKYKEHNNTLATTYNFNVKQDVICSKLRNYNSTLDSALSGNKIPEEVYTNLIDAVHKSLPAMHKYVGIRKRVLGIDELKMYDVMRPLVKPTNKEYSFEEALNIACDALSILGDDYVRIFRNGVENEKWVDVYENKGKSSGAYSFGSYDSYPYILMNFVGELRDIFTLIHEGGHSMNSYFTRKAQPYIYADHSIFTAEVASTVNETLLINYLLNDCNDKELKAYLINFYIDEFKSTLFRQTMFAEFEKICHDKVEAGGSLTADYLNKTYYDLNKLYFGPEMSDDDMIQYEWSRIPHFYRSYYVYQYATGYSAANAISNRLLNEGEQAKQDYLKFLSQGSNDYPIELLKIAGVDMSTEEPILSALSTFTKLVDQLDELTK